MNTDVHVSEYLTVADVARELGVSTLTIRRRIDSGELRAAQLGGRGSPIRIPRAALDAWLWNPRRDPR